MMSTMTMFNCVFILNYSSQNTFNKKYKSRPVLVLTGTEHIMVNECNTQEYLTNN